MRSNRLGKGERVKGNRVEGGGSFEKLGLPSGEVHPLALVADEGLRRVMEAAWQAQAPERERLLQALSQIPTTNAESPERQRLIVKALVRWMGALNCHIECPVHKVGCVPSYIPSVRRIVVQHAFQSDTSYHKVDWSVGLVLIPRRIASVLDSAPPSA